MEAIAGAGMAEAAMAEAAGQGRPAEAAAVEADPKPATTAATMMVRRVQIGTAAAIVATTDSMEVAMIAVLNTMMAAIAGMVARVSQTSINFTAVNMAPAIAETILVTAATGTDDLASDLAMVITDMVTSRGISA